MSKVLSAPRVIDIQIFALLCSLLNPLCLGCTAVLYSSWRSTLHWNSKANV